MTGGRVFEPGMASIIREGVGASVANGMTGDKVEPGMEVSSTTRGCEGAPVANDITGDVVDSGTDMRSMTLDGEGVGIKLAVSIGAELGDRLRATGENEVDGELLGIAEGLSVESA